MSVNFYPDDFRPVIGRYYLVADESDPNNLHLSEVYVCQLHDGRKMATVYEKFFGYRLVPYHCFVQSHSCWTDDLLFAASLVWQRVVRFFSNWRKS